MHELPPDLEREALRILDGALAMRPQQVQALCRQHPKNTDAILGFVREREGVEAAMQQLAVGQDQAGVTHPAGPQPREVDAERQIGAFRILELIGKGGMGEVYLAEQREPVKRRVALKVIKLGMDTKAVLARFSAERQALALMDHSSIAKVFEAGATPAGRPYFAMEYVKGVPITRYCDDHKLSIEDRLALFRQVCSGVQHAHQKGVIHRDLTSNNVLVTVQDSKPVPKIIDFGLARATDHRLTEKTLFTEQGMILGTPEYMSPEQAGLNALDIDMRSDVYTLGVLLYELLTGELPFGRAQLMQAGLDKMCEIIRTQEPERPSTKITKSARDTEAVAKLRRTNPDKLLRRLRGDLDWVVLKCLEKDRTRRYETVTELSADVQRHLDHEPVLARAPSVGYRLAKMARRYRAQLVVAGIVLFAVVAGLAGTTTFWLKELATSARERSHAAEARRQEGIATDKAAEAEQQRVRADDQAAVAQRNADQALARKAEFDQLAGVVLLGRAVAAEMKLYPAWPENIDAMKRWLEEDAGRLLAMRPQVEATVHSLRQRALPLEDPQTNPIRFADESQGFLHDTLSEWLGNLAALEVKECKAVAERLSWAERIAALTLGHPNARSSWQQVREAIIKADGVVASTLYKACPIDLQPQMGLVPIGMNPVTKLWEFYDLRSAWLGNGDPAAIEIPQHVQNGDAAGHIEVKDDTGIVFVLLPGGAFTMGAQKEDPQGPNYDPDARINETTHEVTLAPFFLARHELTQAQWKRLTGGETPSSLKAGRSNGAGGHITWTNPVEMIDWFECDRWLPRHGMALPTEAQWEFGCRAGTTTPWWTGSDRQTLRGAVNLADQTAKKAGAILGDIADWPDLEDGFALHAPVDTLRCNAFGLHHMHGNVWEWCRDYDPYSLPVQPTDKLRQGAAVSSSDRVYRGGSFVRGARLARSAYREGAAPALRVNILGARPARAVRLSN